MIKFKIAFLFLIGTSISCCSSNSKLIRTLYYKNYVFSYYDDGTGKLYLDSDKGSPILSLSDCSFDVNKISTLEIGEHFESIIKKIGFPRFNGISNQENLDFGVADEDMYRVYFSEGNFSSYKVISYSDPTAWIDANKNTLPCLNDINLLELGMSLDEVVSLIGKPQYESGSGAIIYHFSLCDGKELQTWWESKEYSPKNGPYYMAKMEIV